jgi:hypothetical protein
MQISLCLQDFTSEHEACCLAVGQKGASLASGLPPGPVRPRPGRKPRAEEEASLKARREILGDADSFAVVIGPVFSPEPDATSLPSGEVTEQTESE